MTLVDLKYTKKEAKEEAAEDYKPPAYSWGLQIRLEKEELDKLGIKELPDVGDEWHMTIVANVTSVSEQKTADGDDEQCVCLQIQMASVDLEEPATDEKPETPAQESSERKKTPSLLSRN